MKTTFEIEKNGKSIFIGQLEELAREAFAKMKRSCYEDENEELTFELVRTNTEDTEREVLDTFTRPKIEPAVVEKLKKEYMRQKSLESIEYELKTYASEDYKHAITYISNIKSIINQLEKDLEEVESKKQEED